MKTHITVAHSPDSDDAFMFYGLASGNVDTGGIVIDQVLSDIETLNRAAFDGKYEVTAVSFHAYAHLVDKYALLPHGASMGDKYGPIVVAPAFAPQGSPGSYGAAGSAFAPKELSGSYGAAGSAFAPKESSGSYGAAGVPGVTGVKGSRIAIPGTLTTAYLTLRIYEPDFEYVVVPFDEIQQAVLAGKAEAGLLIHEGQLTYQDEGLRKIVDLGEWWAERTGGLPLPLGGNIIRRDLGPQMIAKVSKMLHDSIAYALSHRPEAVEYALQFGRGLDRAKTDRFVGMYVNDLTLAYGERGRQGLERLMADAYERGLIPQRVPVEFAGDPELTETTGIEV
jgi:1,4-dihydroxy-6-naphthoate synthase